MNFRGYSAALSFSVLLSSACAKPDGRAGDGFVTLNENEAIGNSAASGQFWGDKWDKKGRVPRCGDGVVDTRSEACDDGAANGTYGHCNNDCTGMGPRCGDGVVNGKPEACDDGAANGTDGHCNITCTCVATTCAAQGKNCGTISDACGGTLECGTCTSPTTCGARSVPP